MPNITVPLSGIAQLVTRPIVFDIVGQLKIITGIDNDTKIIYPGDTNRSQQAGLTLDNKDRTASLTSGKYFFVEVEEEPDFDQIGAMPSSQAEHQPIFYDKNLNVTVTPGYVKTKVNINFRYRLTSKTEADRWRDDIILKATQLRDIFQHTLTYSYMLPAKYIELLEVIHTLREKVAGYGDIFPEYLLSNSSSRLTLIGDTTGTKRELAIAEKQSRVLGRFSFDVAPDKAQREDDVGTYVATASYSFIYDKPELCAFKYPIIVHNQMLPDKYAVLRDTTHDHEKYATRASTSIRALGIFEVQHQLARHIKYNDQIILPEHDEFRPTQLMRGTGTVFMVLCAFEIPDLKFFLNMKDTLPILIDKDILEFLIKSETPYITQFYQSILQVYIYKNDYMIDMNKVKCDTEGNVKAVSDCDPRQQYHLRFALVTDLTMLSDAALDRLRKYPKAFAKIITAINEKLSNHPEMRKVGGSTYVDQLSFASIYKSLTGFGYNSQGNGISTYRKNRSLSSGGTGRSTWDDMKGSRICFNTVQIASVVAVESTV